MERIAYIGRVATHTMDVARWILNKIAVGLVMEAYSFQLANFSICC